MRNSTFPASQFPLFCFAHLREFRPLSSSVLSSRTRRLAKSSSTFASFARAPVFCFHPVHPVHQGVPAECLSLPSTSRPAHSWRPWRRECRTRHGRETFSSMIPHLRAPSCRRFVVVKKASAIHPLPLLHRCSSRRTRRVAKSFSSFAFFAPSREPQSFVFILSILCIKAYPPGV